MRLGRPRLLIIGCGDVGMRLRELPDFLGLLTADTGFDAAFVGYVLLLVSLQQQSVQAAQGDEEDSEDDENSEDEDSEDSGDDED